MTMGLPAALLPLVAAAYLPSAPDLGKAEALCRPGEKGPALLVAVTGLKDRQGRLKLEVYPSNNEDFLADDNVLIAAGKVFRRAEEPVPHDGDPVMCIRLPSAGAYSVSLLHDRDSNRKFGWTIDGIGFAGNPRLGWGKPKAAKSRVLAAGGLTRITIVMNYRNGLGVAPLRRKGTAQ